MPSPRRSRAAWFIAGAAVLVLVAAGVTYLLWSKTLTTDSIPENHSSR
jgi:hypothetical protein